MFFKDIIILTLMILNLDTWRKKVATTGFVGEGTIFVVAWDYKGFNWITWFSRYIKSKTVDSTGMTLTKVQYESRFTFPFSVYL